LRWFVAEKRRSEQTGHSDIVRLTMKIVGVAEAKAKLSEYLASVKEGEEVLITERGRPVAKIVKSEPMDEEIERLVRSGHIRPPIKPLPADFFDRPRPKVKGEPLSQIVIRERREGW
jgi:prevent-host-death family protein